MNIKSLLLGSAAALVAVSGARAADAVVVAEPEPMEYVRVCDAYGTGFYYMPGTETCLKISGYVRVDIKGGDFFEKNSNARDDDGWRQTYSNLARFQLRVDARSETELGTLRSYAAVDWNYQAGGSEGSYDMNDGIGIAHAYIELGGFRIGKTDSLFSTFTDYSSGVMTDGIVPYGPFGTLQMAYTYAGANGFSAAVALEQGDDGSEGTSGAGGITEDYAPYVVGGVSLTQGWGKVGIVVGYDSWESEVAVKGRLDVKLTETASAFVMAAWDSADEGGDDTHFDNYYAPWQGSWAVWGGARVKFNEKATFNAEVGYDENEDFSVAANVAYELVPNFTITPEVVYKDNFDEEHNGDDNDAWGARIRFQRNF
jgi:Porin subfamily